MSQRDLQELVEPKQRGLTALANLGDFFLSTPWRPRLQTKPLSEI